MKLTDLALRKAKPSEKLVKLSDGGGLQLWIFPDGAKRWRLGYRHDGKQKTLAIGVYPKVTLEAARTAREAAKVLLADGRDPTEAKRAGRAAKAIADANTFEKLAQELLEKKIREKKSERTIEKFEWFMRLARPALGSRPIEQITTADILGVLRPIEARGRYETAIKLRGMIGAVFRYAVASGLTTSDPTGALHGALTKPPVRHRPAITEPVAFGGLLRAIDAYHGAPETIAALKLLALTFARPGEVAKLEWSEINFTTSIWTIPTPKTKKRLQPHNIFLTPSVISILEDVKRFTGDGRYVFPCNRSRERTISENTLNSAIRRMGYKEDEMCAHGFRSAASSMLNECGLWNADAIERQLDHVDKNSIRRAYHRAEYWDERVKIMHYWAERCDAMRRGGDVVSFPKSRA